MLRRVLSDWSIQGYADALYPERRDRHGNGPDRWLGRWIGRTALWLSFLRRWRLRRLAEKVLVMGPELEAAGEEALQQRVAGLRQRLPREGLADALVVEAFALIREVAHRRLGMRHYPVQVMGGYSLLRGSLAEMATGEGKSLTAVLPAVTVALAGFPVHVVTVNDYLARRDAEALAPVYAFFGLSVGWTGASQGSPERRSMYECDVTYCVNKDLVFDYLRDRLQGELSAGRARMALRRHLGAGGAPRPALLRGLCYAIVDEADSICIDEARTPLIISSDRGGSGDRDKYAAALAMAGALGPADYQIDAAERQARLTPAGQAAVTRASEGMEGIWRFRKAREEIVQQALSALYLFERDRHYILVDGKVQIVDEFTGRIMADRSWERGLHQLIETKEGMETTSPRETISRITYQRFFRRYLCLAGMTGTGTEVAPELRSVFGIDTVQIPTNRPCIRRQLGERVFVDGARRWQAVLERVVEVSAQGRAVLVGTRSVEASEGLAQLLDEAGVAYALLNARQDADEARIVAEAGQPGRVTVATNMAGRGTDILLHPDVRAAGGLHVILTEFHESRRVDRQLFGRAGRQGDPGTCEGLVSLEDELFASHARRLADWARHRALPDGTLPPMLGRLLRQVAQGSAERLHARIRRRTLENEKMIDRSLAFSGQGE